MNLKLPRQAETLPEKGSRWNISGKRVRVQPELGVQQRQASHQQMPHPPGWRAGPAGVNMASDPGPSSLARMWDWPPPCMYSQPPACTLIQLPGPSATFCCLGPSCCMLVSTTRPHMAIWVALHSSCWPLRPKLARNLGKLAPFPVACSEMLPLALLLGFGSQPGGP